jgi:hypothetical protein
MNNNNKKKIFSIPPLFIIMTRNELKQIIKETLVEAKNQVNITNMVPSEIISRWKVSCEALQLKISAAFIGKPMTGSIVDPHYPEVGFASTPNKSVDTTIRSIDVDLAYKSAGEGGRTNNKFYISVYANGKQRGAGQLLFSDYV